MVYFFSLRVRGWNLIRRGCKSWVFFKWVFQILMKQESSRRNCRQKPYICDGHESPLSAIKKAWKFPLYGTKKINKKREDLFFSFTRALLKKRRLDMDMDIQKQQQRPRKGKVGKMVRKLKKQNKNKNKNRNNTENRPHKKTERKVETWNGLWPQEHTTNKRIGIIWGIQMDTELGPSRKIRTFGGWTEGENRRNLTGKYMVG